MARIYTTRQLLDPRYVDMMNQAANRRLDMASQDRANLLGSLSRTVGAASTGLGKYIDEEMGKETRRALVGNYGENDPLKTVAAEKFIQTGDPSAMMSIDQMEKTFKARQEEQEERKTSEKESAEKTYKLAVQSIYSSNDPAVRIPAIRDAILAGEKAGIDVEYLYDMLKSEQVEKVGQEASAKESEEEKERRNTLLTDLKDQAAKLKNEASSLNKRDPQAVADFNARRASLQATIDENGMTKDIVVPAEIKLITKLSRKEVVDALNSGKMGRSEGLKLYPDLKKNKNTRKWE